MAARVLTIVTSGGHKQRSWLPHQHDDRGRGQRPMPLILLASLTPAAPAGCRLGDPPHDHRPSRDGRHRRTGGRQPDMIDPAFQTMRKLPNDAKTSKRCENFQTMRKLPNNAKTSKQCENFQTMRKHFGFLQKARQILVRPIYKQIMPTAGLTAPRRLRTVLNPTAQHQPPPWQELTPGCPFRMTRAAYTAALYERTTRTSLPSHAEPSCLN